MQNKESQYRAVFDYKVCYLGSHRKEGNRISIRAAYDTEQLEDRERQKNIIREGLELIEELFGYKSKSFIANYFMYHPELNQTLHECGVRFIQSMKYQKLPMAGNHKRRMIPHYQGEKKVVGQYHLIRNCVFEPLQFPKRLR